MSTAVLESNPPPVVEAAPPANRMAIAVLALLGVLNAGYLLLHRVGAIGTLTCGVGDCGTVQASRFAVFIGVPVPVWGVVGYALILAVALAALQPRFARNRAVAALLFGLAAFAFFFSAYLTLLEAFVIRAWCQWCVVSAILATLLFITALPEARRARTGVPQ